MATAVKHNSIEYNGVTFPKDSIARPSCKKKDWIIMVHFPQDNFTSEQKDRLLSTGCILKIQTTRLILAARVQDIHLHED